MRIIDKRMRATLAHAVLPVTWCCVTPEAVLVGNVEEEEDDVTSVKIKCEVLFDNLLKFCGNDEIAYS